MTVSKSALKRAKTPIQHKRLLSVAAAIRDEKSERVIRGAGRGAERGAIDGWKEEDGGEEKEDLDDEEISRVEIQRLDSETGQIMLSKESGT